MKNDEESAFGGEQEKKVVPRVYGAKKIAKDEEYKFCRYTELHR
jgi:hypothetical protein